MLVFFPAGGQNPLSLVSLLSWLHNKCRIYCLAKLQHWTPSRWKTKWCWCCLFVASAVSLERKKSMHILLHWHDTQLLRGLFKMFINLPKLQFNCDWESSGDCSVVRSQNKSADVFASWENACECACPSLSVPDDDTVLAKPHGRRIRAILWGRVKTL